MIIKRPYEASIVYCDGCGKSTTTDEIQKQMGGTKKWTSYSDGKGGPQQHYCPDCRGEVCS